VHFRASWQQSVLNIGRFFSAFVTHFGENIIIPFILAFTVKMRTITAPSKLSQYHT
jgi:hypothetical protein